MTTYASSQTVLGGPVLTNGTFSMPYPAGKTSADFNSSGVHTLHVFQGQNVSPTDFTASFGASSITITWLRSLTLPSGAAVRAGFVLSETDSSLSAMDFTQTLGWSDLVLRRDGANALAQRNGTSAQTLRVYNTYSGEGASYERGVAFWNSNAFVLGTEHAGTGTARTLRFRTGGTDRWSIGTGGDLIALTDNSYDIGASGATRPRRLYLGGYLVMSPGASVTPANNGELVFEATSNTSVTVKLKGSDGTVRSVVLTLA